MRNSRQDLLTLLISLFILSGCSNIEKDLVGLEVDPANRIDTRLVDTATIRTTTVREDTIQTSGLSQHPFGYLQDTELGTTESNLALSLSIPSASLTFGTGPVLDSAILVLKYGDEFYGDSVNSKYKIDVRQLGEAFNTTGAAYFNNKTWSTFPAVIGTKTISKFAMKDSLKVTFPRDAKKDTILKRSPQLRIALDKAFITSALINAPSGSYTTTAAFSSYFKGLYLSVDKAQSTGKGGLAFFNLSTVDSSRVEIYYRNVSGTTIDTNMVNFGVTSGNAVSNIKHVHTPAVLNQLNNPAQQFSTVYVQPLAGLRTRINFPFISRLKSLGNITINKAELVIQVENSTLDPAPRITLYRTDIAAQRQPVPDNNIGQKSGVPDPRFLSEFGFGGLYDKTKKRYTINIASYIQDIINGKLTQYNTYIAPMKYTLSRTSGSDLNPAGTTAARSILGGGNGTTYKMKLNIIYTLTK